MLTADQYAAEDLLQTALTRAAVRWGRTHTAPEAYVRQIMYREQVSWWRRRARRREITMADPPERAAPVASTEARQAASPRLNVDALWRAGRRRRWAAIATSAAGKAAAAALISLAALSAAVHPAPGPALPGTSKNECFYFSHTGMTSSRFAAVTITQLSPRTSGYWLSFRLERADIHRYADLTYKLQNLPSPRQGPSPATPAQAGAPLTAAECVGLPSRQRAAYPAPAAAREPGMTPQGATVSP